MLRQKGMSLIEVIVVVAVFFMLAAVAVPRFVFLAQSARVDTVRLLADDLRAAADATYRVWDTAGRPETLAMRGEVLALTNGYPSVDDIATLAVDGADFDFESGVFHYVDGERRVDGCRVVYEPPEYAGERARVSAIVDGC